MFNQITARRKIILSLILIVVVLALCSAGYFAWQKNADSESRLQQATVLSQQDAQDKNVLQNELKISKENAEMLAKFIKDAQTGKVQPVNYFTVQAPSVEVAAEQVASRINKKDPTLPKDALGDSDNTVVVPGELNDKQKSEVKKQNEKNKKQDKPLVSEEFGVSVYKNNNYRNWEWSAGIGVHGGDRYAPVELQRNFSKDAAVSMEYHVGGHEKGYEVKYTRKTDKLFLLF